MELTFYKSWDTGESVKIGEELMNKINSLELLQDDQLKTETFPEGNDDAGEEIERYVLSENYRLILIQGLSDILKGESTKEINKPKEINPETSDEKNEKDYKIPTNIDVLISLLVQVNDKNNTHFSLE